MEKITIHRALTKKKILPNEITRKKSGTAFALANRKTNAKINGASIPDVEKNIFAVRDSIRDMLAQYVNITRAIALSNSTTRVTVGGKEYTVTEAIQMKKFFEIQREYLESIKSDYRRATGRLNTENETLSQRATDFARANSGDKNGGAVKPEALEGLIKVFSEANEYGLIDPLGLAELIDKMETEIVSFESEVDAVLSESNATTFIEI